MKGEAADDFLRRDRAGKGRIRPENARRTLQILVLRSVLWYHERITGTTAFKKIL